MNRFLRYLLIAAILAIGTAASLAIVKYAERRERLVRTRQRMLEQYGTTDPQQALERSRAELDEARARRDQAKARRSAITNTDRASPSTHQ